jgi:hypothetical protein
MKCDIRNVGRRKKMDLGDMVIVDNPAHPFYGCEGKIVGKRGSRAPNDLWILIYIASKMRSYLVPQSMLRVKGNIGSTSPSPRLHG